MDIDSYLHFRSEPKALAYHLVDNKPRNPYAVIGFWRDPLLPTVFVFIDYHDKENRKLAVECGVIEVPVDVKSRDPNERLDYITMAVDFIFGANINGAIFFPKRIGNFPLARRAALMIQKRGLKFHLK